MKYSIKICNYVSRSSYTYYVVKADEPLTKFHVWGNIKAFNTLYYDEQRVLNLISEKYPEAERIPWITRGKPRIPYLAKK